MNRWRERGNRLRARLGLVDHLLRAYARYQDGTGDQLAAAVSFYWFLSLFPILLLAISLLGFLYGGAAPARVEAALGGYLPAPLVTTIGVTLQSAKAKAGVLGLVGLLLSGLGWISALRAAIRVLWRHPPVGGNFVVRKVVDSALLLALFATIAGSVVLTGAATAASGSVLHLLGVADTLLARVFTSLLAYLLTGIADTVLFLFLFSRLAQVGGPLRRLVPAALFGATGFALIKWAGAFYVTRTTSKGEATYGTFAVVVGLLVFLNVLSRFVLLTAAFAVTAAGCDDVAPSATAPRPASSAPSVPAVPVRSGAPGPPAGRRTSETSGKAEAKP